MKKDKKTKTIHAILFILLAAGALLTIFGKSMNGDDLKPELLQDISLGLEIVK